MWLTRANISEALSDFVQNHWTSPLSDATFEQLITGLDAENVKRLNAYQDPFGSAWLNVVANISDWNQQISNFASRNPSAWVRKNTLAVVVNLSKRTDIIVFPVPEARDVSQGTTTSILSWNRRWVPSKFLQFGNHMVWPEQTESAQIELP